MIPMMGKSMKDMLNKWSSKMCKDGKVEIEVSKWFLSLSEEVVTHTVFGSSYEDGKAIFELQAQQLAYATNAFHQLFSPAFRYVFLHPEIKTRTLAYLQDLHNHFTFDSS